MEETYLTVKELAELKGCTERYIQLQINRGNIQFICIEGQSTGQGGIQYRIPLSGLDGKIQRRFKRRLISAKKALEPDADEEVPEVNYEALTEDERQEIAKWRKIISDWQAYRNSGESKEKADREFVAMANIQNPELKLTRRTLYRKDKALREKGEAALTDSRGKHKGHIKTLTPEMREAFEFFYLNPNKPKIPLCMSELTVYLKRLGKDDLLPLPSETTFRRVAKAIPIPYVEFFRNNKKEFIGDCAPYIKRMYEDLESNDIWVADNHTCDVMVNKNDKPVRVYLTAFVDVRSRKMTGWCITDNPSSDATIYALKKGCEKYGVPKTLYTDNGHEFLFHDLGGNGFRKKRKGEPLKLPSILDDLDIRFTTALPTNARAKLVERTFYTFKERFSKVLESYTGGTILERPDRLKYLEKNPALLPELSKFKEMVDLWIDGWYNKHPHKGEGMYGKCPDEVFAANLFEKRELPSGKANLMFMRYAKSNDGTLKVGKNGITLSLYGKELQYWNEDLWRIWFGKKVYVRYSPDDLGSVRVFDMDKKFICEARLKTELSYNATKDEVQAAQAETRRAVRAVASYKNHMQIKEKEILESMLEEAELNMRKGFDINPKVISPIFTANEQTELPKASGGENTVIDLAVMAERFRRAKEE